MTVSNRHPYDTDSFALINILKRTGFVSHELKNGSVWIRRHFIPEEKATRLLIALADEIEWIRPTVRFGKRIIPSPRLAAWHGDEGAVYRYSGIENIPLPWNETLSGIRMSLESATGCRFNSVLLNYYRSGQDSMGWHRDNEPELGSEPLIASISLGEERRFLMQHVKDRNLRWHTDLDNGSLLIMLGQTQQFWRHSIPKSKTRNNPRINLTFRQVY